MTSIALLNTEKQPVDMNTEEKNNKINKKSASKRKYIRRSIELHPDVEVLLDLLQDKLRARTHTEVLQKAIQLLAVAVGTEEEEKRKLYISVDDGQLKEVIIL